MNTRIRIATIATFLIVLPALASCLAVPKTASATPNAPLSTQAGQATAVSMGACKPGAQDESIQTFGIKMTSATNGWALGQCALATKPTFAGGSTLQCEWPQVESMGILRTSDGGSTWSDVSPSSVPNRTWHHAEYFLDSMHAWVAEVSRTATACVSQVTTYSTSDGGSTWAQAGAVAVKTAQPTDDVFNVGYQNYMEFVDAQHGWLLVVSPPNMSNGPGDIFDPTTLYATSDGGTHWKLLAATPGSSALSSVATCHPNSYSVANMTFTSATTGWLLVSCPQQVLLMTHDGGATWRPQELPFCTCPVYQATLFDSTHGIITGQNSPVMLATADGGTTWAQEPVPAGAMDQLSFIDAKQGWLVSVEQLPTSYDTAVSRTTDGGKSWSLVGKPGFATSTSIKNAYYPIMAVQFINANVGFVALGPLGGQQGPTADPSAPQFQLLGTQDGGKSWRVVLKQVPSHPCTVGYRQLNGGGGGTGSLSVTKLASPTTAWAQGGLRTTDGGAHWRDVSPAGLREGASTPLYPPGYADFYLDGDHAWQAGVYGSATSCGDHITTFASADGGKTWQQSAPVTLDLPSGYSTFNIALGFTDAHAGWLWVPVGTGNDMFGMAITAVYLFNTSDGGLTWRKVATIDSSTLVRVSASGDCKPQFGQVTFSSATVGWVGLYCVTSQLLVTHDGGSTWKVQPLPAACQCSAQTPTFVDEKHGFMQAYSNDPKATGPTGPTVMATSDGGTTWRTLPPLPSSGYTIALTFADPTNLWALVTPPGWTKVSGGKDSLYRSSDGGQTWNLVQQGVPMGRSYSLLFADAKNGMVAQPRNATWSFDTPGYQDANDIELEVTSDGGHTWRAIKPALGA